jgi:prepilin signal peptidase PulO-like enzyme (type II secretory pathway)
MRSDPIQIIIGLPYWLVVLVFGHPLVLVGFLILLFYWARRGGRRQGAARTVLLLLAIASTGLAAFFVYVGFAMRWSTDGPGLLFVFMGIGGFGILAIVTWILWAVRIRRS